MKKSSNWSSWWNRDNPPLIVTQPLLTFESPLLILFGHLHINVLSSLDFQCGERTLIQINGLLIRATHKVIKK